MNAQELRLGNIVKVNGRVSEVYALSTTFVVVWYVKNFAKKREPLGANVPEKNVHPIPLTTEILDKTTLRKTTFDDVGPVYFNGDDFVVRAKDMLLMFHDETDGSLWPINYLRSVHQLQNWYYLKTGLELKIEL